MFFKVGFFVLLAVIFVLIGMFIKINPMQIEGAGSWTEFYSSDPQATIAFLDNTLGIKVKNTSSAADGMEYSILKAEKQLFPFAGIMAQPTMPDGSVVPPSTLVYLTVRDYDSTHSKLVQAGAVAHAESQVAGGMKFGIYTIPGDISIGIAQYGVKQP
jgi:predicted enzyme related to lactoylglutathione lyase